MTWDCVKQTPGEDGRNDLVVHNDLQVERVLVHHPLDRLQVAPNVVGVEDLPKLS